MYTNDRKRIINLLDTVNEAIDYCIRKDENIAEYVGLCTEALESIHKYLIENEPAFDLSNINMEIASLKDLDRNDNIVNSIPVLKKVKNKLMYLIKQINEVKVRYKALFMPYCASMWTALESIWLAAVKDPYCDAVVMPIPYYDIGDPSHIKVMYDGDKFPDSVPITLFNQYKIEEQLPDMIFIHNPYDSSNNLTRVPEEYFSSNIKQYTKYLIYSPYFTVGAYTQGNSDFLYAAPGVRNSDYVLVQSERVKEIFCSYGHPESKFLVVGSPKVDSILNKMKQAVDVPKDWETKLKGRKIFLLNTHLSYFPKSNTNTSKAGDYAVKLHNEILRAILNKEGCALIWRPHPLLRTMLEDRFPDCLGYVKEMERQIEESDNCVIDRTGDYSVAFRLSDALITTYSSLINEYMITGKPVMIIQKKSTEEAIERAPINRNLNYFRLKPDNMSFNEFIKMVCQGEDPLYEERMDMIRKAFVNMDGTAGKKAFIMIKDNLLRSKI